MKILKNSILVGGKQLIDVTDTTISLTNKLSGVFRCGRQWVGNCSRQTFFWDKQIAVGPFFVLLKYTSEIKKKL